MLGRRLLFALTFVASSLVLSAASSVLAADDPFTLFEFTNVGRSVAAELTDVNGDGRTDLFVAALTGLPPEEKRVFRVYLQAEDGSLPSEPTHFVDIPKWSAVYDIADIRKDVPGTEVVVIRPDRVTVLSLAKPGGQSWDLPVPGPTTAGLADDERGLEPFRSVYHEFGDEPWILVPQIGQLTALAPDGSVRARLAVPRRANYFVIPPTGLISIESEFQVFLDVPKLMVGDIDGDGQSDIFTATRHEIRTFLRAEDGSFAFEPSRTIPLRMVTPRDHIRGSGGVSSEARDIDGDGLLDLLISHAQGSFQDAETRIYVYMNEGGAWDLAAPDQTMKSDASLSSNALVDLDQDGVMELLRLEFSFSVLEVVEMLLSRELDINVLVFRRGGEGEGFAQKAWVKKKLALPFSFETFRLAGFIPLANHDLNGDGKLDFVSSGGGKELEVHPGGPDGPFETRSVKQKMSTSGVIHFADLDSDGLLDFVLFDPHNFDVPIQVGRNRGLIPGTPKAIEAAP